MKELTDQDKFYEVVLKSFFIAFGTITAICCLLKKSGATEQLNAPGMVIGILSIWLILTVFSWLEAL